MRHAEGHSSTQTTLSSNGGDRRWWMRTGMLSAKQGNKGVEGNEWKQLFFHRDMSKATGANKPSDSALWAVKAAWDRGEECYDPARKQQRPVWNCGKSNLKDQITAFGDWPLVRSFLLPVVWDATACIFVGAKILQKMWEGPYWEGVWPCLDPWDSASAHSIHSLECSRWSWATWRALFLPYEEGAGGFLERSAF